MTRYRRAKAAREILKIIPLVMRTVAAELRAAGELPAPAHFGLLTMLSEQPRTLTELAVAPGRQPADDVELDQRDGASAAGCGGRRRRRTGGS